MKPKNIYFRILFIPNSYNFGGSSESYFKTYYKLKIYKGKAQEYSIYKDHYFIKIIADSDATHQFFNKINGQKIENLPPSFEDL